MLHFHAVLLALSSCYGQLLAVLRQSPAIQQLTNKCINVVPRVVTTYQYDICNYCECKYQSRNTAVIKVVVIFIICVVSLLTLYMLFLMCLDPFIHHRHPLYTQHAEDEDSLPEAGGSHIELTPRLRDFPRTRSILNHVTSEQKKWKGTVQEQRKNIYDRHTMLN